MVRKLELRRLEEDGALCLHDAETGEVLGGQTLLRVEQGPCQLTKVIVEFNAGPGHGVEIVCDDKKTDFLIGRLRRSGLGTESGND